MNPASTAPGLDRARRPIRVLLVDDDEFLKPALKRSLERCGCDVVLADSVDGAVATLLGRSFDVVVTDLQIGEGSGLDVIQKTREVASSTKVVLMSGSLTAEDRAKALGLGALAVLDKPFSPMDLSRAVLEASV